MQEPQGRCFLGLMLRSRTKCGVSKHEAAPILRDGVSRLLRMRAARAPLPTLGRDHPSFGSSLVDHNARSSQSLSVTVMTCVAPSIATSPKNCKPSLGGWFGVLGAFT